MKKLLLGTALASIAFLAGCGEDEREAKIAEQDAQIEANQTLLGVQEETFRLNIERQQAIDADIAEKQAALQELQTQIDALQPVFTEAENAAQAVAVAEARLAEIQAESDTLNAALAQIEAYQARALTVAPASSEGMVQSHDVSPVKNWDLYRVSDRTTGLITYKFRRGQVTLNYANLSPQAQEALTECYNAGTCMKLSMSYSIEDGNYRVDRLVDWDARVIFTYTLTDVGAPVQAFSFDELLNAEELHAEADALRAELNSQ